MNSVRPSKFGTTTLVLLVLLLARMRVYPHDFTTAAGNGHHLDDAGLTAGERGHRLPDSFHQGF